MASELQPTRCPTGAGICVPTLSDALAMARCDRLPVLCLCESCGADTVRVVARPIDEIALEQSGIVRARTAGMAERLCESGLVRRAVDTPRSERSELFASVQAT